MQRIRLDSAEMEALQGLPYAWRCLYMELRWRMDIASGCVGLVAGAAISWFTLRTALYVEPATGRKGTGTPQEGALRKWAKGLESAGLIETQTVGKRLIFKLLLAEVGYSAKNKEVSKRTGNSTDKRTDDSACKNIDIQQQEDRQELPPTPPKEVTYQVSGKSTNNTVVLFANEASSSACPHKDILKLWAEVLPMCPQPKPEQWKGTRATNLRTRWMEEPKRQTLTWWRGLFEYIAKSEWFTGRKLGADGSPFLISLTWLVQPKNFYRVVEGEIR